MARQADVDEANQEGNKQAFKGIKWERSCTDVFCCLIFFAFFVLMLAITGYAITEGDPKKIITPFDSVGNKCGYMNETTKVDFTEYPYKHFVGLEKAAMSGGKDVLALYYAVCVKSCPEKLTSYDCIANTDSEDKCPDLMTYGTQLTHGYCLPDKAALTGAITEVYKQMNSEASFAKYITDLQQCWQVLAGMAFGTIIISGIYIFLLRWVTKPLLYCSMLIILVMFILLGGWSWLQKAKYDPVLEKKNHEYATYGAYVAWGIACVYLCFICCCWKNISLGASIMECAAEFVSANIRIVALPIIAWGLAAIFFTYWITTALYLYSVGEVEFKPNSLIANIVWAKETRYLLWVFLFGLLWVVAFLICLQQFIIAAMACMWYFSGAGAKEKQSDAPGNVSLIKAMVWGMWYHLGSVAFGAFLIAVITMIRIVFEYLAKQYEQVGNKDNALYKAVTCCIRCVLWCLDKYVKFITKNAYIQIALQNSTFCKAAWDSFWLIVRHAGRFGSAGMIGWIMMMLGKGTIMSTSAYITILIVKYKFPEVQQPFVPALVIAMVAYVVGSLFLSIFSFSCTAILHCFLLDEESGGGQGSPASLQAFLDHNDAGNAKEGSKKTEKAAKAGEGTENNDMS